MQTGPGDWKAILNAKPRRSRWVIAGAVFVAANAIVFLSILIAHVVSDLTPAPALRFDSLQWKSQASMPENDYVRQRMVDNLLETYTLTGMTRAQIHDLLGPRDDTTYFQYYDLVYYLGDERGGFSIDSEWLVIKFDGDVVTEARLTTD